MKLSDRVCIASESFRAQPAILHYKACLPVLQQALLPAGVAPLRGVTRRI